MIAFDDVHTKRERYGINISVKITFKTVFSPGTYRIGETKIPYNARVHEGLLRGYLKTAAYKSNKIS